MNEQDKYSQMAMLGWKPEPVADAKADAEPGMRLKDFLTANPDNSSVQSQKISLGGTPFEKKARRTPDQLFKDGVSFGKAED